MTVVTDEVHSCDVFGFGSDAHALLMVPARAPSSALVLVAAQYPQGPRVAFTTYDAFVFFFIIFISLFHFLLGLFTFLNRFWLLLFLDIHFLASVLLLLVLEDHSLEVEGVEKGPLSERSDVLRVDGPDLKGAVSSNYHFVVLRNLCDLGVRTSDCLKEVIFVNHRIEAVLNLFELLFVAGVGFDHLQHFFSVLGRNCQSELEEGEVLWIGRGVHGSKLLYRDIDKYPVY